jgi:hypothetical protein
MTKSKTKDTRESVETNVPMVLFQKELQIFHVKTGLVKDEVMHYRFKDGSGSFECNKTVLQYLIAGKKMFLTSSYTEETLKGPDFKNVMINRILPVIDHVADKEGLKYTYPDWLNTLVQEDAARKDTPVLRK